MPNAMASSVDSDLVGDGADARFVDAVSRHTVDAHAARQPAVHAWYGTIVRNPVSPVRQPRNGRGHSDPPFARVRRNRIQTLHDRRVGSEEGFPGKQQAAFVERDVP